MDRPQVEVCRSSWEQLVLCSSGLARQHRQEGLQLLLLLWELDSKIFTPADDNSYRCVLNLAKFSAKLPKRVEHIMLIPTGNGYIFVFLRTFQDSGLVFQSAGLTNTPVEEDLPEALRVLQGESLIYYILCHILG